MRASPLPRLLRRIHYWTSVALIVTAVTIALTGSVLALKKAFPALQPATRSGSGEGLPERPMADLLRAVRTLPAYRRLDWREIDRIDVRPRDGIAKVILRDRMEVQVDLFDGRAWATGYRTSDFIERIHDFSILGDWAKYVLSFGSGLALLLMSGTGIYLFVLPFLTRRRKRRAATHAR